MTQREVVANRFPSGDSAWRTAVAAEALPVLLPGGVFRIWSVTGGGYLWRDHLTETGFHAVTMEMEAGYAKEVPMSPGGDVARLGNPQVRSERSALLFQVQ